MAKCSYQIPACWLVGEGYNSMSPLLEGKEMSSTDASTHSWHHAMSLWTIIFLLTFHLVILRSNFVSYILASHSSVVLIKSSWDKILSKDTLLLFNIMYIQSLVSFSVKSSYIQISWVYILLGYIEIVSDWLVMPQVKCDLIWLIEESYVLPSYQHSIWL